MFHVSEGLFFERIENGNVKVTKKDDKEVIIFEQTIEADAFISMVCSVSLIGETSERSKEISNFHLV